MNLHTEELMVHTMSDRMGDGERESDRESGKKNKEFNLWEMRAGEREKGGDSFVKYYGN